MTPDDYSGRPGIAALIDAALGERVALRYRIGEREGRPLHTDAVGALSDGGAGTVVVDTRKGPVRVDRAAVVAVRVVPPAPARRASWSAVSRLENLCADAWPALVDEPLGGWRLRAAGGFTGRANSALAVGDPGLPTAAALDRVVGFAADHGLVPRLQTPMGSPWSEAARREGWVLDGGHQAGPEVAVLVADLTDLTDLAALSSAAVELTPHPTDDWWAVIGAPASDAERHVLTAAARPGFAVARAADGTPTGALRAAVVEDHLHLSRLATRPEARRRGVGTALTAAAAAWGREQGARWAVLQVNLQNEGARAFWAQLGCTEHHRYHYLGPGRAA
ncbi:GNAT family N-acetyltransferase [Pseudonocardia sp. RS11V-5]|uniref:GNAT family N-acetyltransferase n=1 Tax=Pseudonocardia terrae TaxID=2905831 RepID=UPI001E4CD0CE|nr:GNAT family N-acetyltransferase [Pseudonocardia terrae]MCE3554165.1 GNAT family N-acetyltransferase [Pseudonocardia terrae]